MNRTKQLHTSWFCHSIMMLLICLTIGSFSSGSVAAKETTPATTLLLIEQLGAPLFLDREVATAELKKLGPAAIPALEKHGLTHARREIRFRCETILVALRRVKYEQLVAAFSAKQNSAEEDDENVPGWKKFRALFKDEQESRKLYIKMLEREGMLFRVYQYSPEDLSSTLEARLRMTDVNNYHFSMTCTILFFLSEERVELTSQSHYLLLRLVSNKKFTTALKAPDAHGNMLRSLLDIWFQCNKAPRMYLMQYAMANKLQGGLVAAYNSLKDRGEADVTRRQALQMIAQFEDKKAIPVLESLLEDQTVVGNFSIRNHAPQVAGKPRSKHSDVQMRNTALVLLLHFTDQKLSDYGYIAAPSVPLVYKDNRLLSFGFSSEEHGAAARNKWETYRKSKKTGGPK